MTQLTIYNIYGDVAVVVEFDEKDVAGSLAIREAAVDGIKTEFAPSQIEDSTY